MRHFIFALFIVLVMFQLSSSDVVGQGTAFTYQGSLKDNNVPVNGDYDFAFTLYDALSGGNIVGSTDFADATRVTNGLFTVTIDFGSGAFDSASRWLDIAARPIGSTNAYSVLTPRQHIAAAPYAIFAHTADASALTGTIRALNLGTGLITSDKLASNAVTSSSIAAGSITTDKIASSDFFAIGPTGDLHVKSVSTNPPALPLNGTMTIERPGSSINVASNIVVLEMPKTEIQYTETISGSGETFFQPGRSLVTPLKVRRILRSETSWKDWMRAVVNRRDSQGTVTLQVGTTPAIVLGEAFPLSYHVERGLDGVFHETLSVKAVTYSLE